MKALFIILLFVACLTNGKTQSITLNNYIAIGLESNLALKQNQLSLKQAEFALKEAKGLFFPSASLNSRYSLAHGGRTIDFPIGDLLNPVYSTLNQMLEQQGQTGGFPLLDNQEIQFMRPQEYNASVSIVQPIYSREITLNKRIVQEQLSMSVIELALYKRELVLKIKEGYYNYLKTIQLMELVAKTKEVVNENLRVTEKLFANNMITQDAVLRAKSDISQVKLFETSVHKNNEMAKSYFNFLINRNLNDEILVDLSDFIIQEGEIAALSQNAIEQREELKQIESQTQIYEHLIGINTAANIPVLALVVDAGFQGEELSAFNQGNYVMGSVVLNWTLFNGNINRNKKQQAIIGKQKSETQKVEASNQILLEVKNDYLNVQEQKQNLAVATDRNTEASEVYRIVEKRYREGEASLLELLDARNNSVEAESDLINTRYSLWVSLAQLEKSARLNLIP